MAAITHYQAQIYGNGHYFPERGAITDDAILCLANNGTTPSWPTLALLNRADRLRAALLAGRVVGTSTASISPLTTDDYEAGRLTPPAGSERI